MAIFEFLERNRPGVDRSVIDTPFMLTAGRQMAAASSAASTLYALDKRNPGTAVHPSTGVLLTVAASAILANASHPSAAWLFIEFPQSNRAAHIYVVRREKSLRPAVVPRSGAKSFSKIRA